MRPVSRLGVSGTGHSQLSCHAHLFGMVRAGVPGGFTRSVCCNHQFHKADALAGWWRKPFPHTFISPPRDIVFLVGRDVERDRGRGAGWAKRPRQNGAQLHGSSVNTYTGATKTQLLSILTDGGINIWNESGWSPIGRTRFLTSASEWPDRFAFECFDQIQIQIQTPFLTDHTNWCSYILLNYTLPKERVGWVGCTAVHFIDDFKEISLFPSTF